MTRRFGLNAISLYPWTFFGPRYTIKLAKRLGFDGIQAYPMKGWKYNNVKDWEKDVISFQDAFMFGSLGDALQRTVGLKGEPAPTLLDWALFGKKYSTYFLGAIPVIYGWQHGVAVEFSRGNFPGVANCVKFCLEGGKLCWDTLHASKLRNWPLLLDELPDNSVEIIHAHPTVKQTNGFLGGVKSEMTEMLQMVGQKFPKAPVIVEVFPRPSLGFLKSALSATKYWIDL